jgi:hypothetical protein
MWRRGLRFAAMWRRGLRFAAIPAMPTGLARSVRGGCREPQAVPLDLDGGIGEPSVEQPVRQRGGLDGHEDVALVQAPPE